VGAVESPIGVSVASESSRDGVGLLEAVTGIGNNSGGWKVREIKTGFAVPIGETLGAGDEKVGENVLDGLVLTLGRAGVVLRQLGNGKGEIGTDNNHGRDEFAHCHAVGGTTFGLQDVLFGIRSGTIGGFKDSGVGRLGRGSKVAPVVVSNDFIDIGLAGDDDIVASLENVHTIEFANDAKLVKRGDKVVPDSILDSAETY
jgi:hypothetical protein